MSQLPIPPHNKPTAAALRRPVWPTVVAGLAAVLMALGAILALARPEMLVAGGAPISDATRVYAGYLFSRNLVIALLLVLPLALKARQATAHFMLLAGSVQVLDALVDCFEARWALVPGVLVLGAALLLGAERLADRPFWRRSFWTP